MDNVKAIRSKGEAPKATVLRLADPHKCQKTIEELSRLLAEAKAGRIVGLAYVALHSGTRYSGDVVGRAREFPIYTTGLCRALENMVAGRIGG